MQSITCSPRTLLPGGRAGAAARTAWFALCVMALVVLTAGCAAVAPGLEAAGRPDPKLHTLYIDEQGWLLDPQTRQRIAGQPEATDSPRALLAAGVAPEAAYVQAIIDRFLQLRAQRPGLQLTVFVHGGLNTFTGAAARTDRFAQDMLAEGQYPVFVGWNSGPFTNYFDHLFRVRKGERRPVLAPLTAPLVLAEDVLRSLVRIPTALYKEARDASAVAVEVVTEEEEDYEDRRARLKEAGFAVVSQPPFRGVGAGYWSVANPLKLVTAPLVDGLGTGAWASMLRRTDLVLSKSSAFENRPPVDAAEYADTAATRFLREWVRQAQTQGAQANLIGHSMGTIVVNNILARHPDLRARNVVYMAGAARIKDVENVVVPWLAATANQQARFYNLSLDPYNELAENSFFDSVPRGSLLNWIDGSFGEVNAFKDRTVGGWWNITRSAEDVFRIHALGPKLSSRVTLKRFAIGEGQGPQQHGEFDDHCFWQTDFWASDAPARKFPACLQRNRP